MSEFKAGDVVRVLDDSHHLLPKGKEFKVCSERSQGYYVNLEGRAGGWDSRRFVLVPPTTEPGGLKYDSGKPQWSLLLSAKGMLAAVAGVVAVLGFGAKKYEAHSWREVEDNERRYTDAMIRHLVAIQLEGLQAKDEESGLLHIDHLNCNGLFLGELARK